MERLKNKEVLLFSILIVLLSVVILATFSVLTPAYADVTDSSTLNFNQMIKITNTVEGSGITTTIVNNGLSIRYTGTATATQYNYQISNTFQLVASHKYYYNNFADLQSANLSFRVGTAANAVLYTKNTKGVFTSNVNLDSKVAYIFTSGTTYNVVVTPQLIDLTLMFGAGNEPTFEYIESNNLFPSAYFYNAGTPIANGTLVNQSSAYTSGYNAALSSFDTIIAGDLLFSQMQPIDLNGRTSGILESSAGGSFGFVGYVQLFFNSYIESNTAVTFKGSVPTSYSLPLGIGYLQGSSYVSLKSNITGDFDITLNLPKGLSSIILYNAGTNGPTLIGDLTISYRNFNQAEVINKSYSDGFNAGKQVATDQAKQEGYQQGIADAENYSFFSLMAAVVEAPVQGVLSIFDFEFLGYNLKSFLSAIFTLCVIICVIRLFMGNE